MSKSSHDGAATTLPDHGEHETRENGWDSMLPTSSMGSGLLEDEAQRRTFDTASPSTGSVLGASVPQVSVLT